MSDELSKSIEEWRAKAFSISEDTQLRNILTRSFEALKGIEDKNTNVLNYLGYSMGAQRAAAVHYDNQLNSNPLRSFFYAMHEAIERTIHTILAREQEQAELGTQRPAIINSGVHSNVANTGNEENLSGPRANSHGPANIAKGQDLDHFENRMGYLGTPATYSAQSANGGTTGKDVFTPHHIIHNGQMDQGGSGAARRDSWRWNKEKNPKTLECPCCSEMFTLSMLTAHLTKIHKTTPGNEGITYKCECGYVATNASLAASHRDSDSSHVAVFTVIKRSDGVQSLQGSSQSSHIP
ncbi:hypothetical protein PMAYCL1PPCAC_28793 [Pristionchus mayeri]|uniref:Uncharacterized protein n=1 Tax=Pristionchus mayeri TaxID=1317129 RepID=A0AAN5D8R8_9BILA|nr:hypothetical protein PMAYCL1PPCAC_28793 [Pristionchus mayeri]